MVDCARHHDLLVARQQVVLVCVDERVVRRLVLRAILRGACHVQRNPEVGEHVERPQAGLVRVFPNQ